MSKTPKFYLVLEDGTTQWTNDREVAKAAGKDGGTLVIDVGQGRTTFDSDTDSIVEAVRDDWLDEESDDEGEDE